VVENALAKTYRSIIVSLAVGLLVSCGQGSNNQSATISLQMTFDGANASSDVERMAHGRRLADLLGCTGCHQADFTGGTFNQGRIAPNLTLLISEYDGVALDRAIRSGVARDDRKLRLMPSEMYQFLSDADARALGSYLLSLSPSGESQPPFEPIAEDIALWEADGYIDAFTLALEWDASAGPVDAGVEHSRGRYLAINLCTECHNNQLQGYPNFTPDLTIVEAYSDDELKRLLFEGKGNSREQLGLMSLVSPARNPHLTDTEYNDLVAYLRARSREILEN
jgi:cytochrome c553